MDIPKALHSYPILQLDTGARVFSQGQPCLSYVVLIEGRVKVFARSIEGREMVLYRINPGDICILTTSCLIGASHYPAEAIVESPMKAHVIERSDFDNLLNNCEEFRLFVFKNFGDRLTDLMRQLEQVKFDSIEARLQRFLLSKAHHENSLSMTHQQIATEIGSAREVVSRQLKRLEKSNAIELSRGSIRILDETLL